MFNPFTWAVHSNEAALCNARRAATALSRARVEREEIELYLARLAERRTA